METAKDKAKELVDKAATFVQFDHGGFKAADMCRSIALTTVYEILQSITFDGAAIGFPTSNLTGDKSFWKDVEKELINPTPLTH